MHTYCYYYKIAYYLVSNKKYLNYSLISQFHIIDGMYCLQNEIFKTIYGLFTCISHNIRTPNVNLIIYLHYTQIAAKTKRQIGYCVSGQKVEDLEQRLIENIIPLHENVILLIGTNNFLQVSSYKNIISFLKLNFYREQTYGQCVNATRIF